VRSTRHSLAVEMGSFGSNQQDQGIGRSCGCIITTALLQVKNSSITWNYLETMSYLRMTLDGES